MKSKFVLISFYGWDSNLLIPYVTIDDMESVPIILIALLVAMVGSGVIGGVIGAWMLMRRRR